LVGDTYNAYNKTDVLFETKELFNSALRHCNPQIPELPTMTPRYQLSCQCTYKYAQFDTQYHIYLHGFFKLKLTVALSLKQFLAFCVTGNSTIACRITRTCHRTKA